MRDIKFRAWDEDKGEWCKGYSSDSAVKLSGHDEVFELFPATQWTYGVGHRERHIIINQYTDLKDKNGKEIYEGDIVKFNDIYVFEVTWLDCKYCLKINRDRPFFKKGIHEISVIKLDITEVIGNIYETPELV